MPMRLLWHAQPKEAKREGRDPQDSRPHTAGVPPTFASARRRSEKCGAAAWAPMSATSNKVAAIVTGKAKSGHCIGGVIGRASLLDHTCAGPPLHLRGHTALRAAGGQCRARRRPAGEVLSSPSVGAHLAPTSAEFETRSRAMSGASLTARIDRPPRASQLTGNLPGDAPRAPWRIAEDRATFAHAPCASREILGAARPSPRLRAGAAIRAAGDVASVQSPGPRWARIWPTHWAHPPGPSKPDHRAQTRARARSPQERAGRRAGPNLGAATHACTRSARGGGLGYTGPLA
jgi:hypothetical protein